MFPLISIVLLSTVTLGTISGTPVISALHYKTYITIPTYPKYLPVVAKSYQNTNFKQIPSLSRWKSFAVAELNFSPLENFRGWTVVLHGQSRTGYFTEKVLRYRLIRENRETFAPRMICNIRYVTFNYLPITYIRSAVRQVNNVVTVVWHT